MTGELAGRVAEHINHSRLHVAMLFQDPEDVIETVLEALGAERDEWCMKAAAIWPVTVESSGSAE